MVPVRADRDLAVAFANTLAHDGHGGVVDLLEQDAVAAEWLADRGLAEGDAATLAVARKVRVGARALFASTVAPQPASRVDDGRVSMPVGEALDVLQRAVEAIDARTVYRLVGERVVAERVTTAPLRQLAPGFLALAVLELLTSPDATELRACQAPRCVRYFLRHHGRQQWCKESCANRARVARYAERQRTARASAG